MAIADFPGAAGVREAVFEAGSGIHEFLAWRWPAEAMVQGAGSVQQRQGPPPFHGCNVLQQRVSRPGSSSAYSSSSSCIVTVGSVDMGTSTALTSDN
jgi:hypothetical protein